MTHDPYEPGLMAPPPLPAGNRVHLTVDALDVFCYAMSHRQVLRSLTLVNHSDDLVGEELVVSVSVDSPLAVPLLNSLAVAVPAADVNQPVTLNTLRLQPNTVGLVQLDEPFDTTLTVTVTNRGVPLAIARQPLTILAYNQWMHRRDSYDSYAAFVLPHHPSLTPVLDRARVLLKERTGSDATDGYQSVGDGDSSRVREIGRAVYDAIAELKFSYSNPPAEFEGFGQRIRTPDLVVAERCFTCLDSSVFYASCLAAVGLDPVLFLVRGHAFAGFRTGVASAGVDHSWINELMRRPVLEQANEIAALISAGVVVAVETTTMSSSSPEPFDRAVLATAKYSSEDMGSVQALVNVERARWSGVRALPGRRHVGEVVEVIVDDRRAPTDSPSEVAVASSGSPAGELARRAAFEAPPRVRSWLSSLLDLSRANPLLSLRTQPKSGPERDRTGVMRFDLAPGILAKLEDRLMASDKGVELVPASRVPNRVLDSPDLGAALARDFDETGRLYSPDPSHLLDEIEKVRRMLAAQNAGMPPIALSDMAERFIHAAMVKDLERRVGSIRRRAAEIETQVGSNNLFLTVGTLSWNDPDGPAASSRLVAPLFLVPVRISGKAETAYRITVDPTADVVPNYCLLEKIRQTFKVTLRELEEPQLDDSGIDVARMLNSIRQSLAEARMQDAVVEETSYLAVLNFSTFRLWKDLRDHWQEFTQNSVVRHLVETPYKSYEEPEGRVVDIDPSQLLLPIETDESQLEAVRAAVSGKSFVIEGPPGTGKSQTITNLLAAAIASKKRVLFVAEKQAALSVVKKRLERIGLAPFCLDLHDKGSKPEQIRRQLRAALDFTSEDHEDEWSELGARRAADENALDAYRRALHQENAVGYSVWSGRQELLDIGDGASLEVPVSLLEGGRPVLERVREALLGLPEIAGAGAIASGGVWSLADSDVFDRLDLAALHARIEELSTLRHSLTQDAAVSALLRTVTGPPGFAALADALNAVAVVGDRPKDELERARTIAWTSDRDSLLHLVHQHVAEQAEIRNTFNDSVYASDLSACIAAGTEAATAGLLSRGKKVRAFQVVLAPFLHRPTELEPTVLVGLLQRAASARLAQSDLRQRLSSLPGARLPAAFNLLDPVHVQQLANDLSALPVYASALATEAGRAVDGAMASGWRPHPQLGDIFRRAGALFSELAADLHATDDSARRWMAGRSFADTWQTASSVWLADAPRFLQLQRWCEVVGAAQPLRDSGLRHVAEDLLSGRVPVGDSYDRFRRGLLQAALAERQEAGRLGQFDGLAHNRRVSSFIQRDSRRRELMQTVIPHRLVQARPFRPGTRLGKYGELERELSRVARRLSIRKLMERYGEVLPNLTPCFLMSPDSVARFLPPGSAHFDMVVFDEASQIEVAEAIGAMGRATSVIVVGDSRQMPPSKFGGTAATNPDDEVADEAEFEDLESILSECVESNLPRVWLQCHYRSRHEALIAFSNNAFYEGRLTTFPSPHDGAHTPISWHRVDGEFIRSGASRDLLRTNQAEAEGVVAEIQRRVHDPVLRHQSIGVVTFNVQQQALIVRLIEETGDDDLKALLEDDSEHGLIVRNLESVQGDERDVVIFSIGFAPVVREDGTRRLPLNFGPLNKQGGERRLNVAVTRARVEVVVFCSFEPEEMRLAAEPSKGLALLREYLLIARDGTRQVGDLAVRAPTPPDRHRDEVASALRSRGLRIRENLGLSSFRIDLAVGSADGEDWPVAILLDGPGWAARTTVYDRDALPPNVLSMMGWRRVIRLWLPSWIQEQERILSDIEAAVVAAGLEPSPSDSSALEPPEPDERDITPPVQLSAPPDLEVHRADEGDGLQARAALPSAFARPPAMGLESIFVPAPTSPVGEREVLDAIGTPSADQMISAELMKVIDLEAPIEVARLARIVANRFGLGTVRQARVELIAGLVPRELLHTTGLGTHVWSSTRHHDAWTGYRRTPVGVDRKIDVIAPEEIANAMIDSVRMGHEFEELDLLRHVAGIFGVARMSAGVHEHLSAVLKWAVLRGQLVRNGPTITLP